jgi:uncharacterized protein (TIGR03118 family)
VKRQVSIRTLTRALAVSGAALLALSVAAPANAAPATSRFNRVDLISDQTGKAPLVDPNLVNAWGLALGPATPLWVANNGTNTSTIYAGGVDGATPTKVPLTVTIPGGAPTGEAFNDTTGFVVTTPDGKGGPARFIFASEGGDITGWSPATSTPTAAILAAHVEGAIYKGLAILHLGGSEFLLAADFHNNRIDVFSSTFQRLGGYSQLFRDSTLPNGYAPFNVFVSGKAIYVSYAKQDADAEDEVAGQGLGFVNVFPAFGAHAVRVASHGQLNAPWGLAIAPASFGRFAGALLVGNFGDGRINVYRDYHFVGQLRDKSNKRIAIDGLWALLPGTATTGGTGSLWFSAGPDDEQHGLVGEILPVKTY